jgi:hypothetical protein
MNASVRPNRNRMVIGRHQQHCDVGRALARRRPNLLNNGYVRIASEHSTAIIQFWAVPQVQ